MISWQQFINNPSNRKLTIQEQKSRYLLENSQQLFNLQAINAMYGTSIGAGGGGRFTLPGIPSGEITVTGGTDAITGVAFTGELKGFPEYSTVSPLTTLAYHLKEEDTSLTADTAVDLLFASSSTLLRCRVYPS